MPLTIAEKIQAIAKRKGLKVQDIANALGVSRQAVFLKFKRGAWNEADLKRFADVIGCTFEPVFIDNDTGERY